MLLDERTGRYFQLNPSGALILDALANGTDAQQAAHLLTQRYTVAYDRAITDVAALTNYLRTRTQPFTAHAWVEAGGQPVNEPHTTTYIHPLITIPPSQGRVAGSSGASRPSRGTRHDVK